MGHESKHKGALGGLVTDGSVRNRGLPLRTQYIHTSVDSPHPPWLSPWPPARTHNPLALDTSLLVLNPANPPSAPLPLSPPPPASPHVTSPTPYTHVTPPHPPTPTGRFTAVKLRGRSPACLACGAAPLLSRANLAAHDYVRFTGQPLDDGPPEDLELLDPRVRLQPAQVGVGLGLCVCVLQIPAQTKPTQAKLADGGDANMV